MMIESLHIVTLCISERAPINKKSIKKERKKSKAPLFSAFLWYGNSLFDITEKYILLLLLTLNLKHDICLETTQRIAGSA